MTSTVFSLQVQYVIIKFQLIAPLCGTSSIAFSQTLKSNKFPYEQGLRCLPTIYVFAEMGDNSQ